MKTPNICKGKLLLITSCNKAHALPEVLKPHRELKLLDQIEAPDFAEYIQTLFHSVLLCKNVTQKNLELDTYILYVAKLLPR